MDFWTYGCINCIHMIPTLERLEEKYADELVVIGVHSAKFDNEGQTDNIRQIIQRYDLHHPVINDYTFAVWNAYQPYGVSGWPTFVLLDPRGNIVAVQSGEIPFEAFDQYIGAMVQYYDGLGTDEIDRTPLELALEGAGDPGTALLFPGKVLVDEPGNRLFIADTNHHRIVITDLATFEVLDVIGTGRRGFTDGGYDVAQFNKLQGMALDGSTLYVADTNNHAIRAVDLDAQQVMTIAGTGEKGRGSLRPGNSVTSDFDLRSPWDVVVDGDTLYIAMAGSHQIWAMNLATQMLQVSVGSGLESLVNQTPELSELAQPSGLHLDGDLLYFADSESSSIRVVDYRMRQLRSLAGPTPANPDDANARLNVLFEFGDADGVIGESRLQHALDVTKGDDGLLYITDTYNSKIKAIDPTTHITTTLFGTGGTGGFRDGGPEVAQFDEPGGIDYASGRLYVADTNNHAIRIIDLDSMTVDTVQFPNPEALVLDTEKVTILGSNMAVVTLDEQTVAAGEGAVHLTLMLPADFKLNDLIDSTITLRPEGDAVSVGDDTRTKIDSLELTVPVTVTEGSGTLFADMTVYYCRTDDNALCFIDDVTVEIPVIGSAGATESDIIIERTILPPNVRN